MVIKYVEIKRLELPQKWSDSKEKRFESTKKARLERRDILDGGKRDNLIGELRESRQIDMNSDKNGATR